MIMKLSHGIYVQQNINRYIFSARNDNMCQSPRGYIQISYLDVKPIVQDDLTM